MSNCAQHPDYKGAMGYCPRCRIAELEALDKDRVAQIKGMGKYTISIEEQLAELQAHRDAAWGGSGGMPSYTTLKAELEDTVTECLAAKSNEDIMRKQLAALREALLSAPPCKTEKYMNGETKVMGGPAIDGYYRWYTKIRRKALQEKGG